MDEGKAVRDGQMMNGHCLGLEIGHGATGKVYQLDEGKAVKVYEIENSLPVITREQRLSRLAFEKGIPTPEPFGIMQVGERLGSVFELVEPQNCHKAYMMYADRRNLIMENYISLIQKVHDTVMGRGELPDNRDIYENYLDEVSPILRPETAAALRERIRSMREDLHLVHGDIHMLNVLYGGGDLMLIDLETLSTGNRIFDLAGLFIGYRAFNINDPENAVRFFGCDAGILEQIYDEILRRYLNTEDPERIHAAEERIRLVAFIRFLYLVHVMHFGVPEVRETNISYAIEQLEKLLPVVGNLEM